MFSRLFDSISYPLVAFVFFVFVAGIYYSNKRFNSYLNKTYRALLILTFTTSLFLFFDFFGTDGVVGFKGLESIFARLYILSTMLWSSTYSYYLIIGVFLKEQTIKKLRNIKYILYGFNILLFIWSCFLELEFHHRTIYAIGGKALLPLYVEFAVTGTIYLLSIILNYKKINKTQLVMHATILLILVVMTVLRFFTDWDVNYFTYVICLIPIALYFSSESSAYLLGLELEKSKIEYENYLVEQNHKLNDLSSQIVDYLGDIIYEKEVIRNNDLSEEEFKNARIKIYNNSKKIYDIVSNLSKSESEVHE